jgi:cation:H+ antiporter
VLLLLGFALLIIGADYLVLPVAALIYPLSYPLNVNFDVTVLIAGTFLLLFFTYSGTKAVIDRIEGMVFFMVYVAYTVYLIVA